MITILMPVNRVSKFLYLALKSIRDASLYFTERTGIPTETLIVTDGLSNDQFGHLGLLLSKLKIEGSKIIKSRGLGISAALNTGIDLSQGDLIARVDDDDVVRNERFFEQFKEFYNQESLVLLGSFGYLINEENRILDVIHNPIDHETILKFLRFGNCFIHSSVMIRKTHLIDAGKYRSYYDGIEDFDLWTRMINKGCVANLPVPLVLHRKYNEQSSANIAISPWKIFRLIHSFQTTLPSSSKHKSVVFLKSISCSSLYLARVSRKSGKALSSVLFLFWISLSILFSISESVHNINLLFEKKRNLKNVYKAGDCNE
jgi:glycosyltransferase involved in cell wall biosynthesis